MMKYAKRKNAIAAMFVMIVLFSITMLGTDILQDESARAAINSPALVLTVLIVNAIELIVYGALICVTVAMMSNINKVRIPLKKRAPYHSGIFAYLCTICIAGIVKIFVIYQLFKQGFDASAFMGKDILVVICYTSCKTILAGLFAHDMYKEKKITAAID